MSKKLRAERRKNQQEAEAKRKIGTWQQKVSGKYAENYDRIFKKHKTV